LCAGASEYPQKRYWRRRKDSVRLREVRHLVEDLASEARSLLDVGSNGGDYLDWFGWIPQRVSVDIANPCSSEGVDGIRADFLTYDFPERFDVGLCLQVLEHIPDAEAFAQRMLASARRHVIVSDRTSGPQAGHRTTSTTRSTKPRCSHGSAAPRPMTRLPASGEGRSG
jgi:hypothetical protein